MKIEIDREEDGRWIAEIPELPGVIVYSDSRNGAISKAEALALRVLADRLEHGEDIPELKEVFAVSARADGHQPDPIKSWFGACVKGLEWVNAYKRERRPSK